jgi:UDP-2,4-diacetamido-2,4,6-trideoxy-beta-L-altropyranose hydrolase
LRFILHADASREIGSGHVMRSLALAGALQRRGHEVELHSESTVVGLSEAAHRIGIPVLDRTRTPRKPADIVIFDGYHLDRRRRDELAGASALRVVIDDLGADVADAAFALNQNLHATPAGPTKPGGGELLAGPAYALLRAEFESQVPARPQSEDAERILVTMGGTDPNDATRSVIRALAPMASEASIRIAVGAGMRGAVELAGMAAAAGMHVAAQSTSFVEHLRWAELVVSACGTTVLEAARVGTPLVGIIAAENQVPVAEALQRMGLGMVVGTLPTLDPAALLGTVRELRTDAEWRRAVAAAGPLLVDGRGTERAARAFETGPLALRTATMADADTLLRWRNDAGTLAASFDGEPVPRNRHLAWLAERLAQPATDRVWVATLGGEAAGVVRFAMAGRIATVSVTVAPEWRSAGVGTRIISSGCARLSAEGLVDKVEAWIRPSNGASIAAFRSSGFAKAEGLDDRILLKLPMSPMR